MRRSKVTKWLTVLGLSTLLGITAVQSAWADEPAEGGHWINTEQGPGAAQWVDENGNVTEPPASATGQEQSKQQIGPGFSNPEQTGQDQAGQEQAGQQDGSQTDQAADGGAAGEAQTDGTAQEQADQGQQAQQTGRVIDPARPMVALTFDDGPQTAVGNQIMDCLAAYGGKATFFVVGERCGSRAAELQRMVAEGHEVANHSYDHKYFNKLNGTQIQNEVNSANDAIQAACGVRPTLVRLPGGNINATVRANVAFPMIAWSIDTLDWKTRNTQNTVNVVLNQVKDGDIVLMHELYAETGAAAVQIIPELTARGYQLVTVSEMAQARGVALEAGKSYSSFRP